MCENQRFKLQLINLRMRCCTVGSNVVAASWESVITVGLVPEHWKSAGKGLCVVSKRKKRKEGG